ncbi:hypothetical protein HHL16_18695 [Pseudoflavitalea sp. G-6-1-2]|uniref:hypothetical protein n=1 Tax=Pseudoflavitalea sp. G-6-1-2 TaxID=2728841 RepID=UPI00146BA674|nr:hypothetical protein [Pseudoflavitalea sp. G-6-1-2]NML22913.1 hypothetical protein [Pseudoflavitalea sp. G-6-1-2]
MKIQKSAGVVLTLAIIVAFLTVCNNESKPTVTLGIKPVNLPVIVPGFNFPEDSNTIYGWMNNPAFPYKYDSASVYKHAWGIWAGLTAKTDQVYAGDTLLAYETWLGISDIQNQIIKGTNKCDGEAKSIRAFLSQPHQFGHGLSADQKRARFAMEFADEDPASNPVNFWVTVSYDPNAACFAVKNQILKQSVINSYAKQGAIGNIPAFPNSAITIKPSYYVAEATDGLIKIPVWTDPPPTLESYGPKRWANCVYVDVKNQQPANKKVVPVAKRSTNQDSINAATINLNEFIHFNVDEQMAIHMNRSDSTEGLSGKHKAKAGQIALLICMHVGTKEISNWTWQTFYWAPDPSNPRLPSTNMAAALRPSQLQGAASHYALATAYTMVLPNQPITGGTNTGVQPVLAYNPYLEAAFHGTAPEPGADFQMRSVLLPGKQFGVQTNCMSCHAMATVTNRPGYTTDQYISLDTSIFINNVLLDFAWSIEGNMILDSTAASTKAK